jgi:hypothetical protein
LKFVAVKIGENVETVSVFFGLFQILHIEHYMCHMIELILSELRPCVRKYYDQPNQPG